MLKAPVWTLLVLESLLAQYVMIPSSQEVNRGVLGLAILERFRLAAVGDGLMWNSLWLYRLTCQNSRSNAIIGQLMTDLATFDLRTRHPQTRRTLAQPNNPVHFFQH